MIRKIIQIDEEICLKAVRKNPFALQFVKEQNKKICLAAVKKDPFAIKYVNEKFLYLFDD